MLSVNHYVYYSRGHPKLTLEMLFPLENAINYNCLPLRISLSNCLFSGVTDELTRKMKHFSLITSCNYSSCKGTSSYTVFIIVYSYDIIWSYICCLSKHQRCHSISKKKLTLDDSKITSMCPADTVVYCFTQSPSVSWTFNIERSWKWKGREDSLVKHFIKVRFCFTIERIWKQKDCLVQI